MYLVKDNGHIFVFKQLYTSTYLRSYMKLMLALPGSVM